MRLAAISFVGMIFAGGCSTSLTRLELHGDQAGPAVYEFQEAIWRAHDGGVEVVGYGVMPFYNSPNSIGYEPRWPVSGSVVFRMHALVEAGGAVHITLLAARELGPGDDEILTGEGMGTALETVDERTRRIELHEVPIKSRNRPGVKFTLSGTIVGGAAGENKFEHELRQFEVERAYRK